MTRDEKRLWHARLRYQIELTIIYCSMMAVAYSSFRHSSSALSTFIPIPNWLPNIVDEYLQLSTRASTWRSLQAKLEVLLGKLNAAVLDEAQLESIQIEVDALNNPNGKQSLFWEVIGHNRVVSRFGYGADHQVQLSAGKWYLLYRGKLDPQNVRPRISLESDLTTYISRFAGTSMVGLVG